MSGSPRRRLRDAVLEAMIPAPGGGLPALADLDREAFWTRFDATAPAHLRLGMQVTAIALGATLPRALGHLGSLDTLSPTERDEVLGRAAELPLFRDLVEVAKIVACLAYFDDANVQATVRGTR